MNKPTLIKKIVIAARAKGAGIAEPKPDNKKRPRTGKTYRQLKEELEEVKADNSRLMTEKNLLLSIVRYSAGKT
jgi:hypothetical protein